MYKKRRQVIAIVFCFLVMGTAAGCTNSYEWGVDTEEMLETVNLDSVEKRYDIKITAGDTVLSGVLYDTDTAEAFVEMLPLTVELWHPAPGFAKAFDLPERILRYEKSGYEYEPGSLAYWYEGPSVALIYQASREETVVPVVPIGRVTSDTSILGEYNGVVTIELENKEEERMMQ